MNKPSILWVDDEIDLLTPHILFLEAKGYEVRRCSSGADALLFIQENPVDLVLLDENMPGLSGLETLDCIKKDHPNMVVIMVTNNQDEYMVHSALEGEIADFLVKPLLPNQLAISIKKVWDQKEIICEKNKKEFLKNYQALQDKAHGAQSLEDFTQLYQNMVAWQITLDQEEDPTLTHMLEDIVSSANKSFATYIGEHYTSWFKGGSAPVLSHSLLRDKIIPAAQKQKTLVLLLDNLRLDHWEALASIFEKSYAIQEKSITVSLLPTVTQYARNAIFAGMTPLEIREKFPKLWESDSNSNLKNEYEKEFLDNFIKENHLSLKIKYLKINREEEAANALKNFKEIRQSDLSFVVCNFIDQLSHANTSNSLVKSMTPNPRAYRKAPKNWLENSSLNLLISEAAKHKIQLIVCTDHGSVLAKKPSLLKGHKEHTNNLRYKHGHKITPVPKDSVTFDKPHDIGLPKNSLASSYIFAREDVYFVYPNQYHVHASYYKDTYQHGGISMEEMLVPFLVLQPK
ncbi:MAG: bifunctional response regulator/alkaline phosphatase family protein [Flavobacteriaceae bacterium]|nr:bifunctional response regulator/alkaline phosphatase family protein [Flavobacteriaceae bacterium]MCI5087561.1 bifunctional response regulator/alkaline phosphatase family protein [Flavobacteriaceae bacterium]CAI8198179.1 MAG: C4-dicarboxylate transport transcriptional regulatory protein DctD [SAR116 cluster bacterium]